MNTCLIHYFSGTGNTYTMVKALEREMTENGYVVQLCNIELHTHEDLSSYDLHLFCFPIYGFGAPSIMMQYMKQLKTVQGTRAAVICTSAGYEGLGVKNSVHVLKKCGFHVLLTDMVLYTYNWTQVANPKDKEEEARVFALADARVQELAIKIVRSESVFLKRNPLLMAVTWVFYMLFSRIGRKMLGKGYIADESCNGCGKCKRICPARTIRMSGGRPRWGMTCEGCQRCINMCPKEAIQFSVIKLSVIAIFELLPIPLINGINNHLIEIPFLLELVVFGVLFIVGTYISVLILNGLEKKPAMRRLLQFSYTKGFRRNVATGFELE